MEVAEEGGVAVQLVDIYIYAPSRYPNELLCVLNKRLLVVSFMFKL